MRPGLRWHLDDGEQGVHAVERRASDRDPDDGQGGARGQHAGEVRRAAGAGDDHRMPRSAVRAEVDHVEGRAMRGHHADLDGHAELGEDIGRRLHRPEIRVAAHHDGDGHVCLLFVMRCVVDRRGLGP